jgi:hypothetical protein
MKLCDICEIAWKNAHYYLISITLFHGSFPIPIPPSHSTESGMHNITIHADWPMFSTVQLVDMIQIVAYVVSYLLLMLVTLLALYTAYSGYVHYKYSHIPSPKLPRWAFS